MEHNEVNTRILQEIGLDVTNTGNIFDQDTGTPIYMNERVVVAPGYLVDNRTQIEFNPYDNKNMMYLFFSYFMNKYSEETGVYLRTFYDKNGSKGDSTVVECYMSDGTKVKSASYIRDTLRLADIIIQFNGGEPGSLSMYDIPLQYNGDYKSGKGVRHANPNA